MSGVDRGARTVVELIAAAVAAHPGATAVVAAGGSLTYAELDGRADHVAGRLHALGVGGDALVGVCLDRSLALPVALLGVLKAGGACVPLDPAYPPARLAAMVADAGLAAVVTGAGLPTDRLPAGVPPVLVDDAGTVGNPPPSIHIDPEDLAYVIYTSGSTGMPKGVLLTHRGLVSHHVAVADLYGLAPGDRVLQFCSLGFDASIEEMFPTWAAGATVVFRPDDVPLLGREWADWLRDQGITVLNLPTAYWHAWVRDLDRLGRRVPEGVRLVVVGGEKALGPAYRAWRRLSGGRSRWVNAYGPTETTCMSTFWEPAPAPAADPDDDGDRDPPIGRPLPGTTVLVVDEALQPVAAGVTGELLIGGPGLARGYLHDPELTARRFVEPPATPVRMYRTGDLVRLGADGLLDYVGRADDQVKIQGFRVECGEVEAVLARHGAVAACAVVAQEDPPRERRLVAYVVPNEAVDSAALRRFLAERVPPHMVPAVFTFVDDLPLTDHGKLDRSGLGLSPVAPAAPPVSRSAAEDRMAAIWSRVLGVPAASLDVDDDFFEVGGHSLLATQVIAHVREEFGTQTPLRAVFESPTLGALAAAVAAEAGDGPGGAPGLSARRRAPGEPFPLALGQEQMWALESAARPPGLYNFTALHRFEAPVDAAALRQALAAMVDRHEILRTGFGTDGGRPYQFTVDPAEIPLTLVDRPAGADLSTAIGTHEAAPFDLAQPPLVRVALFRVGAHEATLAVTFDHLIADGTGAAIFMRELLAAYEAIVAGGAPAWSPLALQFGDFACWQRASVGEDVLPDQLAWWAGVLDGMPLGPALPFDHLPGSPTRRIASRAVTVPAATRARLEDVARATGSTVFVVAVAAVSALLGRAGGTTDVVLSTTVSGRKRAELEDMIGTFSGMSRIRTDISGDPTFAALVARARDRVLGIFDHQDVPFLRVRRALFP
ncbi:MAG TPA: amino acid adenylation domain-containing protein, partial [Acidimicrobiales bacterium]|nr:amino acid adenylation domain-containing protein [Acidimicrobiales bacterium]